MKLEDQVVSLELAKKLKELGFKQESLFYWVISRNDGKTYDLECELQCGLCSRSFNGNREGAISAYTVAELGEMLPERLKLSDKWGFFPLTIGKLSLGWRAEYRKWVGHILQGVVSDSVTEVDARAKMLIYLKENNLL